MTKKRIKKLVNFFYSSNDSNDVPLRLCATMGMGGFELTPKALEALLVILNDSKSFKKDLIKFIEKYE